MAVLAVIMTRGFDDDRVVVSVDGRVVFDQEHVRLRRQINRCAAVECAVSPGEVDVEVRVPGRGLAGHRRVQVTDSTTVLAAIGDSGLEISDHPGVLGDA